MKIDLPDGGAWDPLSLPAGKKGTAVEAGARKGLCPGGHLCSLLQKDGPSPSAGALCSSPHAYHHQGPGTKPGRGEDEWGRHLCGRPSLTGQHWDKELNVKPRHEGQMGQLLGFRVTPGWESQGPSQHSQIQPDRSITPNSSTLHYDDLTFCSCFQFSSYFLNSWVSSYKFSLLPSVPLFSALPNFSIVPLLSVRAFISAPLKKVSGWPLSGMKSFVSKALMPDGLIGFWSAHR